MYTLYLNLIAICYQEQILVDEALARAINNIHLEQEVVPRKWYEKLWKDYKILRDDHENLNIRFKIGLGLWRVLIIFLFFVFIYYVLNKIFF